MQFFTLGSMGPEDIVIVDAVCSSVHPAFSCIQQVLLFILDSIGDMFQDSLAVAT